MTMTSLPCLRRSGRRPISLFEGCLLQNIITRLLEAPFTAGHIHHHLESLILAVVGVSSCFSGDFLLLFLHLAAVFLAVFLAWPWSPLDCIGVALADNDLF